MRSLTKGIFWGMDEVFSCMLAEFVDQPIYHLPHLGTVRVRRPVGENELFARLQFFFDHPDQRPGFEKGLAQGPGDQRDAKPLLRRAHDG